MSEKFANELPSVEYDDVVSPPTIEKLQSNLRSTMTNVADHEQAIGKMNEAIEELTTRVNQFFDLHGELNNKTVNMANRLEEHLHERDAHNPGTMGKK
jgi:chromosome segregation ATPase